MKENGATHSASLRQEVNLFRPAVLTAVVWLLTWFCVAAEPKLKEMKSVEVVEGMKTFLKCELGAGNPSPKFKWYKEGVDLANIKNKLKGTKLKRKKE